jgi:hypothetical protein
MRRAKVKTQDIAVPPPGSLFARLQPPRDERLVQLCSDVLNGTQPSYIRTARIADLEIHVPEMIARVQSVVAEMPSMTPEVAQVLKDPDHRWLVYRNAGGRLIMFDDYLVYVVALALGLTEIRVQVCGEARPDIEVTR